MVLVHKLFEVALDNVDKVKQNHLHKYHHLPEQFVVARNEQMIKLIYQLVC
jgi:hypothetical protein